MRKFNKKGLSKITLLIFGFIFFAVVGFTSLFLINSKVNKSQNSLNNDKILDTKNSDETRQYLDKSRNLKSEYEYKEIFDSFAVMLTKEKTYIIRPNENYFVNSMRFSQGFFNGMEGYYKTYDGKWGAHFNINVLNEQSLSEVKNNINPNYNYEIILETPEYILLSNGVDYCCNFVFDDFVFEVQLGSTDDYFKKSNLNNQDIINIIKNIKTIINEDDLKEPYLVDKVINVKLSNNSKIKSYLMINDIENDIMNDVNYSIDLSNFDDNGEDFHLQISYCPEKIMHEYNLSNKVHDNPNIFFDQNLHCFIISENSKYQIFDIGGSDIDGNDIKIETYKDFVNFTKYFFE